MVYLVFSKGGREGGLLPGKKSFNLERNARPNHGMTWKLSLLPGNLWGVCNFFFQNHYNCPTVGAGGPGIYTKTSRWGLRQCYQILFEGDVYLKCILLARNVVFKIGWIDFFILWKKGWDK